MRRETGAAASDGIIRGIQIRVKTYIDYILVLFINCRKPHIIIFKSDGIIIIMAASDGRVPVIFIEAA